MASFYDIVILIPSDIESHIPGVPDRFVDQIMAREWTLPEDSDMDLSQINQPALTLADKVFRFFMSKWKSYSKIDSKYFVQFEQGSEYTHMHILIDVTGVASMVLGRTINQISSLLVSEVYLNACPLLPDWIRPRKTKKGGSNVTVDRRYIYNYFLKKEQPELQWAWSNMEEFKSALLNLAERRRLVAEYGEQPAVALAHSKSDASDSDPVVRNKTSARYMALVNWLVENGITSEKQWIQENQESYLTYNASSSSRSQIKSALDNAAKIMTLTKCAADYLIGKDCPENIEDNRMYKIFSMNGYDPAYVGSILVGWCRRQYNKRNSIWLYGPATTGKTIIASAIAHAVPFFGCVNWTNENFPFNDCVDKMVIWWEEGKMTNKVVEAAKAILGGSQVRVDQKCKSSQQIDSTPVIITSNTDMTMVVDGNCTSFEHRQPLEDRMFMIHLGQRLDPNFGKVTKREVREFFKWAECNMCDVNHDFHVAKGFRRSPIKRKLTSGEEDYISPTKKLCKSLVPAITDGEDALFPVPESDGVNLTEPETRYEEKSDQISNVSEKDVSEIKTVPQYIHEPPKIKRLSFTELMSMPMGKYDMSDERRAKLEKMCKFKIIKHQKTIEECIDDIDNEQ